MSEPFRVDSGGVYHCPEFDDRFAWQRHGFGSRRANPTVDVTLRQTHSAQIVSADNLIDREKDGDGLFTDAQCLSIGVRTADCVSLLLLDSHTRAIAAVHAGWRGTAGGIVERAVECLCAHFGSRPERLSAAIGPCIRACCYQVSEDVALRFAEFPDAVRPDGAGKFRLDLAAVNISQLQVAGVQPTHIFDSGLCTFCLTDEFFSYRREPTNPGRMLTSICRLD